MSDSSDEPQNRTLNDVILAYIRDGKLQEHLTHIIETAKKALILLQATPSRPIIIALALGVPVCLYLLALAMSPGLYITALLKDLFIPLGAGYRYILGQMPHEDFYTPIGYLYFFLHGQAAHIFGFTGKLPIHANFLALPVILVLAAGAVYKRLPYLQALLILVFLTVISTTPMGDVELNIDHMASYNRHGWALAIVALIIVLVPSKEPKSVVRGLVDLTILSTCLGLTFYLKITFTALIGAGMGLAFIAYPKQRMALIWAGLMLLLIIGAVSATSMLNNNYLDDLLRAKNSLGVANHYMERVPGIAKLKEDFATSQGTIFLYMILVYSILQVHGRSQIQTKTALISVISLFLVIAINNQNQSLEMEGIVVCVVVLSAAARLDPKRHLKGMRYIDGASTGLLGLIVLGALWTHGWQAAAHYRYTTAPDRLPIFSTIETPINDISVEEPRQTTSTRVGDIDYYVPHVWAGQGLMSQRLYDYGLFGFPVPFEDAFILEDGVKALHRFAPQASPIMTVSFSNPFPVLTQTRPPKHIALWWHYGRTFSEDSPVDPVKTLSDTNVIMQPKLDAFGDGTHLWAQIGDQVRSGFEVAGETPFWTIWVRR